MLLPQITWESIGVLSPERHIYIIIYITLGTLPFLIGLGVPAKLFKPLGVEDCEIVIIGDVPAAHRLEVWRLELAVDQAAATIALHCLG